MIRIVEVGPRDGLQNEKKTLDIETRLAFVSKLVDAGLKSIEVGAFVSSEKIPQMAMSKELVEKINFKYAKNKKLNFPVLVPNERGMKDALESGVNEVAIFAACTEGFSKANINCSIAESFERFKPVMELANKNNVRVRGYLSTAFYCPYDGKTKPQKVLELTKKLLSMGCYEVSIGDTIGHATPGDVAVLLKLLKTKKVNFKKIAMHFHDTKRMALANVLESLKHHITVFDASVGGLGGCPYAPGARGNVATEDVVYMLNGMKLKTGVDIKKLQAIKSWITPHL